MLDFLATLYGNDTLRYALWHVFDSFGVATAIIETLRDCGVTVWEDFSITR